MPKKKQLPGDLRTTLTTTRENLDRSQDEIAQLVGVTQQEVSYWETGKDIPSPEHLEAWAGAVGIEVPEDVA